MLSKTLKDLVVLYGGTVLTNPTKAQKDGCSWAAMLASLVCNAHWATPDGWIPEYKKVEKKYY